MLLLGCKTAAGVDKWKVLPAVVKACLCLSHGNADVERGFSKSGNILTEGNTAMSLKMLNARLTVSAAMMACSNKPHLVPVTRQLLKLGCQAHSSYTAYLAEQNRAEEELRQQ
jgi:hypothetical protein